MPSVLLDGCVPAWLERELPGVAVTTAKSARLDGLADGPFLAAVAGRYDVLITLDQVVRLDEEVAPRSYAVIVLSVADHSPSAFRALVPKLAEAIGYVMAGDIVPIGA